ncbi:hypothetical protein ACUH96_00560 [Dermabacteraceae bacterium P13077]
MNREVMNREVGAIVASFNMLPHLNKAPRILLVEGPKDEVILKRHHLNLEVHSLNGKQEIKRVIEYLSTKGDSWEKPLAFLMDRDYDIFSRNINDMELTSSKFCICFSEGHDIFMDMLRYAADEFDHILRCRYEDAFKQCKKNKDLLLPPSDALAKAIKFRKEATSYAAHLGAMRIILVDNYSNSLKDFSFHKVPKPVNPDKIKQHGVNVSGHPFEDEEIREILETNDELLIAGDHDFEASLGVRLQQEAEMAKTGTAISKDVHKSFRERIDRNILDKAPWFLEIKNWASDKGD